MDACDPEINIQNLKTLIKQNIGTDLKLTRSQICDVYSTIQDGKLPLPPLIMSSDRSFLMDRKSPISRSDFEKLFSPTTKIASLRRIAKKVGIARHADSRLTKAQLVNIIGHRLHGLNIHEPIRLRIIPKKKTEKSYTTNSNTTFNYNRNGNENGNVNRNENMNVNRNENTNVNRNENSNNISNKKLSFKAARVPFKQNTNNYKPGIFTKSKVINEETTRQRKRNYNSMYDRYFPRYKNRIISSNELASRETEKTRFYSNTPENAYKKLTSQGKINESYNNFKPKYEKEKKKYYKITPNKNIQSPTSPKTPIIRGARSAFSRQQTTPEPQTPQTRRNTIPPSPATITEPQPRRNNIPVRNLNANFKKEQEKELNEYLNDNEIANQSIRNGFLKMLNNGTNLANIKTKIRNQVSKNLKEQQNKNNANKRKTEGNTLRSTYNKYNDVSNENKNKIISNYVNGKKKQVRTGLIFRGTKNGNGPMYASIADVEKEISNRNAKVKANRSAKKTKERLDREAKERKDQKKANRNAKNEQKKLNKEEKEKQEKEEKEARKQLVLTLLQQNRFQRIKTNPAVRKVAERFIEQKPFAAKNIDGVEKKIQKLLKLAINGDEKKRRESLAQYAKAKGLNLTNKTLIDLIKNPTSTNTNIDELVEMRKQEKQKREEEVQDIRNNEEGNINTNVNTILKNYVNGKSEYANIEKVKEAIEKIKKNKGLIAEQKIKNKEKLERKVETYKGSYGNTFNTVSKPVLNAFNKGTINYKKADKELNNLVQKQADNNAKAKANKNNANNLAQKQTGAIALRNTHQNKLNDPKVQKIISNFETRKTKGFFSSNVKYKTMNNANAAIRKIQKNRENKQAKINKKDKNKQNKINKKEAEIQANLQKRQESLKEFEQFLKNQANPRLSYENIMKIRSISLLHNHVHLRGKNVSVAKGEAKKIIDDKKKEILKSPNKNSSKNTENSNNKVKRINQEAEKRKLANLEESKQKQANALANAAKAEKERRNAILEAAKKKQAKELANAAKAEKERRNAVLEAGKKKQAKELANAAIIEKERRNANKKAAAQNRQLRASLIKKVKSVQMDQKVKNKLLNQLKNYSVPIKNVAPSIEQTIKSEKLNGNYNEAENRKKRQEVKKKLANYISKKDPNMSRADRKKYIDQANLKQWRIGIFTGSQGMSANQAFERIRKNINKNISAKIKKKQDEKEVTNRERKRVQAKLINTMTTNNTLKKKKENLVSEIEKKMKPTVNAKQQGAATQVLKNTKRNFTQKVNKSKTQTNLNQIKKNFNSKVLKLQKQKWVN